MKKCIDQACACLCAVIGAGFASGRELMSFFTCYGPFSWVGIGLTVLAMGSLCLLILHAPQERLWQSPAGRIAFSLLLCLTAGAMTCAAGELFCLLWPFSGGYVVGVVITLGLSLFMAGKGLETLKSTGRVLVPCLFAVFAMGCLLPPHETLHAAPSKSSMMIAKALAYAGLNMTLAAPALAEIAPQTDLKERRLTSFLFACMLLVLIVIGNVMLLKQPQLIHAPLPTVELMRHYGRTGFILCGSTLYAAVFSTLLAAQLGLRRLWLPRFKAFTFPVICAASLLFALFGFEQLVDELYPFSGWSCLLLMLINALAPHLNKWCKCDRIPGIKN